MSAGESSFENALQRVSGHKSTSTGCASPGSGQAASQEYAESSAGSADISQAGAPADNLLGCCHNHQDKGADNAPDPNRSSGMSMLMALLNELQNVMMADNPAGMQLQPGQGADDAIYMFFDSLSTTGDQAAMGAGGGPGLLEKLQALLKPFEAAGESKHTAEIQNLIQTFDAASGESAETAKPQEITRFIQNLDVLSKNGSAQAGGPNQTARAVDFVQAANSTAGEKPLATDLLKVLTEAAGSHNVSSDVTSRQGVSENAIMENQTPNKQALNRTVEFAVPRAVSGGENTGPQFGKSADSGFNPHSPVHSLQTDSSVPPNDATLQNAKVVSLKPDSPAIEALAGKMANPESGNQENGFSFNGQQQNDLKASERVSVSEQSEMVQKKFQSQTLDQIVQKAALYLKSGQNEVQINLKPDFLGQIRMQIITDGQQVTVRMLTEFPMVKELIESNAHQLRSELQNYGLDIDELEVSVSQHSDQHVADHNRAEGSAGKNRAEKKTKGEAGESENRIALSSSSDSLADDVNPRVDFFV